MKNPQVRLRLPREIASGLRVLPVSARHQAVGIMLRAQMEKIDLTALVAMRGELASLGTLINQSLRTSWGQETDREAAETVVARLKGLFAV